MNLQILIALVIVAGMLWFLIGRKRPWFDWVFLLGSVLVLAGVGWLIVHYTEENEVPDSISRRLFRFGFVVTGLFLAWLSRRFKR